MDMVPTTSGPGIARANIKIPNVLREPSKSPRFLGETTVHELVSKKQNSKKTQIILPIPEETQADVSV